MKGGLWETSKRKLIKLPTGSFCGSDFTSASTLVMGVFDSKPLNAKPLNNRLRNNPILFGVPFVMIMVVASYALVPFVQTKYELQDRKVSKVRQLLPPEPRVQT